MFGDQHIICVQNIAHIKCTNFQIARRLHPSYSPHTMADVKQSLLRWVVPHYNTVSDLHLQVNTFATPECPELAAFADLKDGLAITNVLHQVYVTAARNSLVKSDITCRNPAFELSSSLSPVERCERFLTFGE